MISIRTLEWPSNRAAVFALDTSVILDRVYRLNREGNSFTLEVVALSSPQTKRYELVEEASLTKAVWGIAA
ncbi:MAG TPA: hypothetical protein VFZ34_31720, partial [Blastocatellia bacterium]|nr:hypothetical protein [Blastocatellia bacterium]